MLWEETATTRTISIGMPNNWGMRRQPPPGYIVGGRGKALIDSNLSWKYHIESICHKISKSIGIIAKIRHYVPRRVLLNQFTTH